MKKSSKVYLGLTCLYMPVPWVIAQWLDANHVLLTVWNPIGFFVMVCFLPFFGIYIISEMFSEKADDGKGDPT